MTDAILLLCQLLALFEQDPFPPFLFPKTYLAEPALGSLQPKNKTSLRVIIKALKSNAKLHYASAKANAKATARTLHAVAHCVSRLAEAPSDESAAVVTMPGPESVGKIMRPEEVETSCPPPDCWRKIVLTCKTSPAAMG